MARGPLLLEEWYGRKNSKLYEAHVTLNVSTPDVRRTSNVTNGKELGGVHIAGGDINRVHSDFIFILIFKPRKNN